MASRIIGGAAALAWCGALCCVVLTGCDSRPQSPPTSAPTRRPVAAPASQPTGPQPCLQVAKPTFDLGRRWSTEGIVKHDFVVANVGKATLHIKHVASSCGCTHVGNKDVKIEPDEQWKLAVELDMAKQANLVAHKITVFSNDPKQPKFVLKIRGVVRQPVVLRPYNGHFFGRVGASETRQQAVTLKNNTDEPMDLKLVRCDGETFSAKVESVTPGKEYKLIMTARPPYRPGPNTGRIELTTGLKRQPKIEIRPQAFRTPRIVVAPTALRIAQPLPHGAKDVVSVRNNGDSPLKVLRVTTALQGVTSEIALAGEGKVHNITLRFPNGLTLPKGGGQVVIHTDDKEFAEIKVGVFPAASIAVPPG